MCLPNPFMSSPQVAAPRAPCKEPAARFGIETQLSAFRSRWWTSASLLGHVGIQAKIDPKEALYLLGEKEKSHCKEENGYQKLVSLSMHLFGVFKPCKSIGTHSGFLFLVLFWLFCVISCPRVVAVSGVMQTDPMRKVLLISSDHTLLISLF